MAISEFQFAFSITIAPFSSPRSSVSSIAVVLNSPPDIIVFLAALEINKVVNSDEKTPPLTIKVPIWLTKPIFPFSTVNIPSCSLKIPNSTVPFFITVVPTLIMSESLPPSTFKAPWFSIPFSKIPVNQKTHPFPGGSRFYSAGSEGSSRGSSSGRGINPPKLGS